MSFLPYSLFLTVLLSLSFAAASSIAPHQEANKEVSSLKPKLKFTDLIEDVQYLILEQLDFEDLMYLVEAGPTFTPLSIEVFRRKYRNTKLHLFSAQEDMYSFSRYRGELENKSRNTIVLSYLEIILNTFKHFGHVIKHVTISNHNIDSNKSAIIGECMNEYGGESLKHLTIEDAKGEILEHFTAPFNKLEELTLQTCTGAIANTILPFDQIFPNVRRLNLELRAKTDYSFLDCHLKHLEHLHLVAIYDAHDHMHQIEAVLRQNPQIQSIETKYFPSNYIQRIHELLPNIEKLTINGLNYPEGELNFANVKYFDLIENQPATLGRLSFPKLETMKLIFEASFYTNWMDFFRKHQNISQLYVRQREYVNEFRVPLVDITSQLQNLTEVTIVVQHHLNIDLVKQFFDNHPLLTKFVYIKANFGTAEEERLRERFQDEWDIQYKQIKLEHESNSFCSGLIFEKKEQEDEL